MAKVKIKYTTKMKTVDGKILHPGDKFYFLTDNGVKEGLFGKSCNYSKDLWFADVNIAELYLIGRTVAELYINKDNPCICDIIYDNDTCRSKHLNLRYRPDISFDADLIVDEIARKAKLEIKGIKIYEKYKRNYDKERWLQLAK
jgi:hypothetical protein